MFGWYKFGFKSPLLANIPQCFFNVNKVLISCLMFPMFLVSWFQPIWYYILFFGNLLPQSYQIPQFWGLSNEERSNDGNNILHQGFIGWHLRLQCDAPAYILFDYSSIISHCIYIYIYIFIVPHYSTEYHIHIQENNRKHMYPLVNEQFDPFTICFDFRSSSSNVQLAAGSPENKPSSKVVLFQL